MVGKEIAHDVKNVSLSILDKSDAFLLCHKNVANCLIYLPQLSRMQKYCRTSLLQQIVQSSTKKPVSKKDWPCAKMKTAQQQIFEFFFLKCFAQHRVVLSYVSTKKSFYLRVIVNKSC